jgi:hypothetical protein
MYLLTTRAQKMFIRFLYDYIYVGVPPLRAGSGYAVLPLVGAAHHASRRVPTIPHAASAQFYLAFLAASTSFAIAHRNT